MAKVKHPIRGIQLPLISGVDPYAIPAEPATKTVLGGMPETKMLQELQANQEFDDDDSSVGQLNDPPALNSESRACGWLEEKTTERKRKHRDPWICKQWWLHWEESGGKKRSRYVPKAKLADIEHSVYGLKRPIQETLELLGTKK
jgi:hypothetical protein